MMAANPLHGNSLLTKPGMYLCLILINGFFQVLVPVTVTHVVTGVNVKIWEKNKDIHVNVLMESLDIVVVKVSTEL